jgi:hypothetical protein
MWKNLLSIFCLCKNELDLKKCKNHCTFSVPNSAGPHPVLWTRVFHSTTTIPLNHSYSSGPLPFSWTISKPRDHIHSPRSQLILWTFSIPLDYLHFPCTASISPRPHCFLGTYSIPLDLFRMNNES